MCGLILVASGLVAPRGSAQTIDASALVDGDALLASRNLAIPVEGTIAAALRDTFADGRRDHRHEAIDIAAPKGTRVFAVDDGMLVKLFTSVPGGLTVYQFDPQSRFAYYYAHLDRYADGLREGMALHRCQLLGYVGTSGNAAPTSPHLHFAVFQLGPERRWWNGSPLNPYPALTESAVSLNAPASGGLAASAPVQGSPRRGSKACG